MNADKAIQQLRVVAELAGLVKLFGNVSFTPQDIEALQNLRDAERLDVRFSNESGPIGVLHVEVFDRPEGPGLVVGLRGWMIDGDVACVQ